MRPFLICLAVLATLSSASVPTTSATPREPEGAAAPPPATAELAGLDVYLRRLVPFGFSGAVLVARDDDVLLNAGYGLADPEEGVSNTAETVFSVGSITKQFTAAAVLRLQMDGVLSTDDPITRFLDDVPADKRPITVRQLLTHTSGIVPNGGSDFARQSRESAIEVAMQRELDFPPGEGFTYSNLGYSLLAAIVEIASGRPYEEYLRERLLLPAGMKATGYTLPDWEGRTLAHYSAGGRHFGSFLDRPGFPQWNLLGNGGILSTTGDMLRWHRALQGDELLSPEAKAELYRPERADYAAGWRVRETDRGRLVSHDGGSTIGVGATFLRYLDDGTVIVAFVNRDGETVLFRGLQGKIEEQAFGGEVEPPPSVEPRPVDGAPLVGRYALSSDDYYLLEQSGGGLRMRVFGHGAVSALLASSPRRDRLDARQAASVTILRQLADGSPEVFEAVAGARLLEVVQRRIARGEAELGAFRGFSVIGSVDDSYTDYADTMTFVRMEFARGGRLFRLHWEGDRVAALGGEGFPEPLSVPLVAGEDGWSGYHVGMELPVFVSFRMRGGEPAGLRLEVPGAGVEASYEGPVERDGMG